MDKEKLYIKGFNNGYILAKHEPELLSKVTNNLEPSNTYIEGLFSGKEQFEVEKTNTRLDELKDIREKGKDRESELER